MNLRRLSLLWKIWLSTSVALTAMFAVMGYFVQRSVHDTATRSLQEEAKASSKAYESLWESRAGQLESVASALSGLPATRKALRTRDEDATYAALSLWKRAAGSLRGNSFVLLADRDGEPLGWLPSSTYAPLYVKPLFEKAKRRFPEQASGFFVQNSVLHQLVLTPLYEEDKYTSDNLWGVLVAGFTVNHMVAADLKESTGKSEFIFVARGQVFASTLGDAATGNVVRNLVREPSSKMVSDGRYQYVPLAQDLFDFEGKTVGKLFILRSFVDAQESLAGVQRRIFFIWEGAVVIGLLLTYLVAERIVKPVKDLDYAASEVAMQNYDHRVPVESDDELGRLAATFNKMCESLQAARGELIRRERVATIGRLASSIVHDLRNPLAAIYGGSEMLVDTNPTPEQTRRIAENIYKASRRIQELLDDLVRVTRGKMHRNEPAVLREVVVNALSAHEAAARAQRVRMLVQVPQDLEVMADRPRLEGVFFNLAQNALEVMPDGGEIRITASSEGTWVMVEVIDSGPGIAKEVREQLFQPFVSHGKKNGLGLGLALARQTVLDHGGDLWASSEERKGACFRLRLPLVKGDKDSRGEDAETAPAAEKGG